MWSAPPWSVSYTSLKYMSYCSWLKNVGVKEKRLTRIHFFFLNIIESFSSRVLFLLKVTHHFWGVFLWTNAWDAAAQPLLAWQLAPVSFLPWWRPYWCVHILFRIPLLFVSLPLPFSSIDNVFYVLPFFLFLPNITFLSPCFPTSITPYSLAPPPPFFGLTVDLTSPFHCVFLCKQLGLPLCVLLQYPPRYIMLNSEKSRGICIWKRL